MSHSDGLQDAFLGWRFRNVNPIDGCPRTWNFVPFFVEIAPANRWNMPAIRDQADPVLHRHLIPPGKRPVPHLQTMEVRHFRIIPGWTVGFWVVAGCNGSQAVG